MASMYTATIISSDSREVYHDDVDAGAAPVVAAHNIETAISVLVGNQSVDVYKMEPVYDSPDGDITGWMEDFQGGPVRLWRELVDLRDSVDVHDTAIMGGETFAVCNREHGNRLLTVMVDWYQNVG